MESRNKYAVINTNSEAVATVLIKHPNRMTDARRAELAEWISSVAKDLVANGKNWSDDFWITLWKEKP
jgi:hypothetical protein